VSVMGFKGKEASSFFRDFLDECGGSAVIDGGFATELERHGADLNDQLWSAKCLVNSSSHLVRRVLLLFLSSLFFFVFNYSFNFSISSALSSKNCIGSYDLISATFFSQCMFVHRLPQPLDLFCNLES